MLLGRGSNIIFSLGAQLARGELHGRRSGGIHQLSLVFSQAGKHA